MTSRRRSPGVGGCRIRPFLLAWLAALLCPALLPGAPQEKKEEPRVWASQRYRARRSVTLPENTKKADPVLLRLGTAGMIQETARDLRLVADHRQLLPLEVLEVGPGDTVLIRFYVQDPAVPHHIYFGSRLATSPPRPSRKLPAGLLLELWELPDGDCESWEDARRLLATADRRLGMLTPASIFRGIPPLGRNGPYLARYTGFIDVRKPGKHTFETVSDGASFLRIDDRLVASWPGFHDLQGYRDPEQRALHSGEVELEKGLHAIEYVVATRRGGVHLAGWAQPEEKRARPISARHFLAWRQARAGVLESREGRATADFDWRITSDTNSDVERHDLAAVAFRFRGDPAGMQVESLRWDLGDGQEARGAEVEHVYLKHGSYEVKLAVTLRDTRRIATDDRVETLEATRRVVVRFESLERLDLNALLETYHEKTRGHDVATLPPDHLWQLIWLRRKDYRWEKGLHAAVDAWLERDLPLRQGDIAALGLSRASDLVREGTEEKRARLILERLAAAAPGTGQRQEARVWLAWMAARSSGAESPRFRDSLKTLEEIHGKGAGDAARRAGLYLARCRLREGQVEEARKILLRLEEEPGLRRYEGSRQLTASLRRVSFDNLLRQENYTEARDELERWEWELPVDWLTGALQLARVRYLRARQRPDEALRELESIERLATARQELPRALLVEAEILRSQKRDAEARRRLERLVKEFPERPESKEAAALLDD